MKMHLRIWMQENQYEEGLLVNYELDEVSAQMSFLEMLDVLNEKLIQKGSV